VGYEAIDEALAGDLLWHTLLLLAGVKIAAVSLTLGSGGSGGVFAPSLFIGAMTGGTVGAVVNSLWPEATAHPGAYALVGMGAVVAAGTHAPITAIVILFELTGDYKIILPLMISCIIATLLSMQIHKPNLYTMKLLRRGIDLRVGQTISVLRHLRARDLMRGGFISVPPDEPLMGVVSRLVESPGSSVFVCGEVGEMKGVITTSQIRPHMRRAAAASAELTARDMMLREDFPVLAPGDYLDEVMQRLGNYGFEAPVLEGERLVGVVRPQDVEARYNAEVFKRDMASSMTVAAGSGLRAQAIPGVRGMSMSEIEVPASFVGRTLGELHMRREYDVTVLLVKRRRGEEEELVNQLPDARHVLRPGDVMLVMGPEEKVEALERLAREGETRRKGWGLGGRERPRE
jgi:CIC family chloride channel protein